MQQTLKSLDFFEFDYHSGWHIATEHCLNADGSPRFDAYMKRKLLGAPMDVKDARLPPPGRTRPAHGLLLPPGQ